MFNRKYQMLAVCVFIKSTSYFGENLREKLPRGYDGCLLKWNSSGSSLTYWTFPRSPLSHSASSRDIVLLLLHSWNLMLLVLLNSQSMSLLKIWSNMISWVIECWPNLPIGEVQLLHLRLSSPSGFFTLQCFSLTIPSHSSKSSWISHLSGLIVCIN